MKSFLSKAPSNNKLAFARFASTLKNQPLLIKALPNTIPTATPSFDGVITSSPGLLTNLIHEQDKVFHNNRIYNQGSIHKNALMGNLLDKKQPLNQLVIKRANNNNNSDPSTVVKNQENDKKKKEHTEIEKKEETEIEKKENESEITKSDDNNKLPSSSAITQTPPSSGDNGDDPKGKQTTEQFNQQEPAIYPEVLAIPISRRPLFPGFYKPLVVTDSNVIDAIKEMMNRKQPYVACFMLKNPEKDTDVIHSKDEVYDIGVFAQITKIMTTKDEKTDKETMTVLVYPHRRVKLDDLIPPSNVPKSNVAEKVAEQPKISKNDEPEGPSKEDEHIDDESEPTAFLKNFDVTLVNVSDVKDQEYDHKSPVINALTSEILKVFKEISQLNTMFRDQIAAFSVSIQSATTNIFEEPAKLADFAAAVSAGEEQELQDILQSFNVEQRLEKSLMVLKKELMNAELQNKISKDVETKIQKRQREYYLMEQLKGIKAELGIDDGRDKLIQAFKDKASKLKMPENVAKVFNDEVNKLNTLETSMSEFGVVRNYLDWITSLPWGLTSKEQYNISRAKGILDKDHYGMKDVKDRILEFIAVSKLLGKVSGKIICFVGPPGVGKTSIGKSIAHSLNRQFARFSVGGMTDVAEIKGHRRTYIGALPGRIIQSLKKCQTQNPLILIDEIDKIGHGGIHGDPSAALLELLDPEQNNAFLDNYLDIPIDLSKILFVCTANTLDTIPRPLLDRMEVIEVSGYVADEKLRIVKDYLIPMAKKSNGLGNANVTLTDDAIMALIKYYCRESGVRNLKKHVEKIYRKVALNIVSDLGLEDVPLKEEVSDVVDTIATSTKEEKQGKVVKEEIVKETATESEVEVVAKIDEKIKPLEIPDSVNIIIKESNLKDYVGPSVFTTDRLYETTPPGVVMGLAWTSMGGCSLYIESVLEQPLSHTKHASFERTGHLGDVMKESSRLAYSFTKMYLSKKFPDNRFFERASIHLHCPEGAVPKDGPSAGVTMATSFISLALNKCVDPTVAMTGELTLTGKVLRIGGLKEKAIAAKRSGAKTIIFPKDNLSDWEDLPETVKEGLEPLAADWYDQIYERLFSDITTTEGNKVWESEFKKIEEKEKEKESKHKKL